MAVTIKGFASDWSVPEPAKAALDAIYRGKNDLEVSAADFGAKGDGIADDTAALNAFLDYITANKKAGFMPGSNYRITAPLIIPSRPGWSLRGVGNRGTLITQDTDNVAVIQLGNANSTNLHHFTIKGLWFTFKNFQPATNVSAVGILHYDMAWQAIFDDIGFKRGHYGSVVRTGLGMPWGTTWDNIHFGDDLSGGAMNWSGGTNAVPNNKFGRFFVELGPMAGPVFHLRGYNFTWDTVEFIQAQTDTPKLFVFMDGTKCQFGTFKVENSPLTTGKQLVEVSGNSYIEFGHISWNGGGLGTANLMSGTAYLFSLGSGTAGDAHVRVGSLEMYLATSSTSGLYAYRAGRPDQVSLHVDRLRLRDGWKLENLPGGVSSAATAKVKEWVNGNAVARNDANHTIALGDANTNRFTTAFTFPRTINLPSDGYNLHNGLYYDLIFDGAINGTNTAVIQAGSKHLATVNTDKVALRCMWLPASPSADGWFITTMGV